MPGEPSCSLGSASRSENVPLPPGSTSPGIKVPTKLPTKVPTKVPKFIVVTSIYSGYVGIMLHHSVIPYRSGTIEKYPTLIK